MHEVCTRFLDGHTRHDALLAGVNTQRVEPHLCRPVIRKDTVLLLWDGSVGDTLAATSLDSKNTLADSLSAFFVNFLRKMSAGVNKCQRDLRAFAILELVYMVQDSIKGLPDVAIFFRPSHDETLPDSPGLTISAPADNLILKAVVLCIDTACQTEHSIRKLCIIMLTSGHELAFVCCVVSFFPESSENCVEHGLELCWIILCFKELPDDRLPCQPWRAETIEPEGSVPVIDSIRILCNPFLISSTDIVLCRHAAAFRTAVFDVADRVLLPAANHFAGVLEMDVIKIDEVILTTVRTLHTPVFLRPFGEFCSNRGVPFDRRSGDLYSLGIVERDCSGCQEIPWITFTACIFSPAVSFVAEDVPCRNRCQLSRSIGSDQCQHSAWVFLLGDCVVAVSAFSSRNLFLQMCRIPEHRCKPSLGVIFCILLCRHTEHGRSRIVVDQVSDHVVDHFRLSDL